MHRRFTVYVCRLIVQFGPYRIYCLLLPSYRPVWSLQSSFVVFSRPVMVLFDVGLYVLFSLRRRRVPLSFFLSSRRFGLFPPCLLRAVWMMISSVSPVDAQGRSCLSFRGGYCARGGSAFV